jgi:hypothetical protein
MQHVKNQAKSSIYIFGVGAGLALAACNGGDRADNGCPSDEVCSPKTTEGLYFRSYGYANRAIDFGPELTAIGGTQTVNLYAKALISQPLAFDFAIDDGAAVGATVKGPHQVSLVGKAVGSNYLRIKDPVDNSLFDRISVGAAALAKISVSSDGEIKDPTDSAVAFAAQSRLAIELFDRDDRHLIDESATIAGAQITRGNNWDTASFRSSVTVGTQTVSVTAAGLPTANLDINVVAGPDRIEGLNAPTRIKAKESKSVCFRATAGSARVLGLGWTFTINGIALPAQGFPRNCTSVTVDQAGTAIVVATAGGMSKSLSIGVDAATRRAPATLSNDAPGNAGEVAQASWYAGQ